MNDVPLLVVFHTPPCAVPTYQIAGFFSYTATSAIRPDMIAGPIDLKCNFSNGCATGLADWPASGIPQSPGAWLLTVARRKAIDAARRRQSGEDNAAQVRLMAEELEAAVTSDIPDQRLALMFACAPPAIDASIRAPLILQTILGFDAATIASAFLVAPATMGQRLARAKNKIREAGVPFRVPERTELRERLDAVLAAIYAAFAEGWSDPASVPR